MPATRLSPFAYCSSERRMNSRVSSTASVLSTQGSHCLRQGPVSVDQPEHFLRVPLFQQAELRILARWSV